MFPPKHQLRRLLSSTWLTCGLLLTTASMATDLTSPVQVADFSPGLTLDPIEPWDTAAIGGRLFFSADQEKTGREPWISDGTGEGTYLLADLCPGSCSSRPIGFAAAGDRVVFLTTSGQTTTVNAYGAGEVKPLLTLPGIPFGTYPLADGLYFDIFANQEYRLFRSDGTAEGTGPIATLCVGPFCAVSMLGVHNGALYFQVPGPSGQSLRRLPPGTSPASLPSLAEFPFAVTDLLALNDAQVTFRVSDSDSSNLGIWITDGTAAGTRQIDDGSPATQTKVGHAQLAWRGRLYYKNALQQFVSTSGQPGDFLPVTGLPASSQLLAANSHSLLYSRSQVSFLALASLQIDGSSLDLVPGAGGNGLVGQVGEVFFFAHAGRFWATDGTPLGTKALPELAPFAAATFGDHLAFAAFPSSGHQNEMGLWQSDGTFEGTREIAPTPSVPRSSGVRPYRLGAGLVADLVDAGEARNLWRVDADNLSSVVAAPRSLFRLTGNDEILFAEDRDNLQLFALTSAGLAELPAADISPGFALSGDGKLFFTDSTPGEKLIVSDGTTDGTRRLFDLNEGSLAALPSKIVPSGQNVFFVGHSENPDALPNQLWVFDRATNEVRAVPPAAAYQDYGQQPMIALGAKGLVFPTRSFEGVYSLWHHNGSSEPRSFWGLGSLPQSWVALGERLFIATASHTHPYFHPTRALLQVSDLTPDGTYSLLPAEVLAVEELTKVGDHVFYRFISNETGAELGFSDGTPGGTSSLDLRPGKVGSSPRHFFALDAQRVVFAADADEAGNELWISDGTREGTFRLTDLAPGPASSSPSDFALVGNRLFFQADDGDTGRELWALDLPPARPGCPSDRLCLLGGRFEVEVRAIAEGESFSGQRAFGTSESGIFTFFSPNNWEFLVKVLDGCAFNDHFWVYASAATDVAYEMVVKDRATGQTRTYVNTPGEAAQPILDSAAFATCEADPPAAQYPPAAPLTESARRCENDLSAFCLGDRFRVHAEWQTAELSGKAMPVASGSADSGLFTFFSPSNWELMVKVLDGCALNGHHWVFAAGTTDVGWTLTVEDLSTGEKKVYNNVLGDASITLTDTLALGGCSEES